MKKKSKKTLVLYQARTNDRYQLIIAQFDKVDDLARWAGVSRNTMQKLLKNKRLPNFFHAIFEKVIIYDNKKNNLKN